MTLRTARLIVLFLLSSAFALQAQSQAPQPNIQKPRPFAGSSEDSASATFYRLEFAIREMDREKLVDTRNYTLSVQSGASESIMAGSEVPYPSSAYSTSGSGPVRNISYRSVGVSINCNVKEVEGGPNLGLMLEISDHIPPQKESDPPVFRKVSLNSIALLSVGKPTTVAIVEDPSSRHKFQVDVTAIKLK